VYVEKPMATAEADSLVMIQTAREQGVRLMVGYQMRYLPAVQWLQQAISEQRYGPPFQISAWTESFWEGPGTWIARRDLLGGGALFDMGCHYIDLIQWFLGEPDRAALVATRRGSEWMEGEGTALVSLGFPSGAVASYGVSWAMRHTVLGSALHVHCSEALLVTDYATVEVVTGRGARAQREVVVEPPQPAGLSAQAHTTLGAIQHFLDCIETGAEPLTGGEEALKSLRILWRLYEQGAG
jgi:predicted dehydrogenase